MSTQVFESAVISAPIEKVWAVLRPADNKFQDTVKSCVLDGKGTDASEVGGVRTITYKDGTTQKIKLTELSDARHLLSYELIESTPAVSVMSAAHTIRCRRVTDPGNSTVVEFVSDYSSDATDLVLADSKYKKIEWLKALQKFVTQKKRKHWMPLESNPRLMNKYVKMLGVDLTGLLEFQDVLGLDADAISWIQSPQLAILLTFPINKAAEEHRKAEELRLAPPTATATTSASASAADVKSASAGTAAAPTQFVSPKVYHMKQTVGNACGTVALVHAVANNAANLPLQKGKFFEKFLSSTAKMDATARAAALEESPELEVTHQATAADPEAKSSAASSFNDDLHFNCFVCVESQLYELDGRKNRPINHGPTTPQTLLKDAAAVIKQFMARAGTADGRFAMVVLAPPSPFSD